MPASADRQRARRKSNKAADYAAAGVLQLICTLPMDLTTRGPLMTAALAMVLASGRERVLQAVLMNHPESAELVQAAMMILDEQMNSDPDHFLHEVFGSVAPEVQADSAATTSSPIG